MCPPCLNLHRSETRKQFYTDNKDYAGIVELKGNDVFRKYISNEFDIVCILNCIADMLIKPKYVIEDLWLPVQLKATIQKDSRHVYKFVIKNKDYTNTVLVCICVSEEKFWVFEGADIPKTNGINIFNKSEASKSINNKFLISNTDLSSHMIKLYSKSNINNSRSILSIPITEQKKVEYKYKLIREDKFNNILQFEYPEIDSTVYDFICNELKVQEKVAFPEKNTPNVYRVNIRKTKNRNDTQPYNEKDNDVYWFNLMDTTMFYVVPNEILNKLKYLANDTEKGKVALLLYSNYQVKIKGKQILSLELNDYMFDYDKIDRDKIKKIFNIPY